MWGLVYAPALRKTEIMFGELMASAIASLSGLGSKHACKVRSPSNVTVITRNLPRIFRLWNIEIHAYFTDFSVIIRVLCVLYVVSGR